MRTPLAVLLVMLASPALPADDPPGKLLTNPTVADPRFKPHQMPFDLPNDGVARAEFSSEPFYAVILASPPPCSVTEEQRLAIQKQFPDRKVFAQRFDCEAEETITYTHVKAGVGFIAVYAGRTREEAKVVLADVVKQGKFPGANLRRMQVVLVAP
jgi:hypothetical protein